MSNLRTCRNFAVASALSSSLLGWTALAHAMPGEVSFTPTGFKLSIMRIVLSATDGNGNPTSQAALYTCPKATEEECLVDVTDQTSLDAIATAAGSAKVNIGTYDTVQMEMCAPGKNGMTPAPGFIRGTFTVSSENKTYVTSDAQAQGIKALEPGDSTQPDFAKIGNWSCNTKTVRLTTPVTVSADTPTDLTVVVDPELIAFSTPNTSGGMGGCRGQADGQARGICVSYPSLVSLVNEPAPELDRFLIAHHKSDPDAIIDSKANAYVVIVRSSAGLDPITAFVRPYYSETSAGTNSNSALQADAIYGGPAYFGETLVSSIHVDTDGGIDFTTGGSLDGNSAIFKDFTIDDHKGVVSTREQGDYQYHAIPLAPSEGGAVGAAGAAGASSESDGGSGGEGG